MEREIRGLRSLTDRRGSRKTGRVGSSRWLRADRLRASTGTRMELLLKKIGGSNSESFGELVQG